MKFTNFEDELFRFWKKPGVSNQKRKDYFLCNHKHLIISFIILAVIIICLVISASDKEVVDEKDSEIIILFVLFITIVLVYTFFIENEKNKELFRVRNLNEIYSFMYLHSIYTVADYEKIINRLKSKQEKIVEIKFIDEISAKTILSVFSFVAGVIFNSVFIGEDGKEYTFSIYSYAVLALLAILLICMLRMMVVSLNTDINKNKYRLSLLIDDPERIKYELDQFDIDNVAESNKKSFCFELDRLQGALERFNSRFKDK